MSLMTHPILAPFYIVFRAVRRLRAEPERAGDTAHSGQESAHAFEPILARTCQRDDRKRQTDTMVYRMGVTSRLRRPTSLPAARNRKRLPNRDFCPLRPTVLML